MFVDCMDAEYGVWEVRYQLAKGRQGWNVSVEVVMTAGGGLKKGPRKNEICSEVHVGGWEGTNGSSKAEESSGQSAGKFKPPVVASGVKSALSGLKTSGSQSSESLGTSSQSSSARWRWPRQEWMELTLPKY